MRYPEDYVDKIIQGDCLEVMKSIPDNSIDLTVTSPPYDNLRTYQGFIFDFKGIAMELYRVTKDGGIVVWVVGDETKSFCETLSSFKQAIYFVENCHFNLLDTMIYKKKSYAPAYPHIMRYASVFEYMFIFSKGKPKTFNELRENKLKNSIGGNVVSSFRQKDGSFIKKSTNRNKKDKSRTNVWEYLTGSHAGEDKEKFKHPASFPNKLAEDHIKTWSNEHDIILDPMCGSGTTLKMAKMLNRRFIGFDISQDYVNIANKRVANVPEKLEEWI